MATQIDGCGQEIPKCPGLRQLWDQFGRRRQVARLEGFFGIDGVRDLLSGDGMRAEEATEQKDPKRAPISIDGAPESSLTNPNGLNGPRACSGELPCSEASDDTPLGHQGLPFLITVLLRRPQARMLPSRRDEHARGSLHRSDGRALPDAAPHSGPLEGLISSSRMWMS